MLSQFNSQQGLKLLRRLESYAFRTVLLLLLGLTLAAAQDAKEQFRGTDESRAEAKSAEVPPKLTQPPIKEFVIGANDVLWISVWKEPDLSQQVLVRSDGNISLPLIGEVKAAGQTTQQLQAQLTEKLKDFVASPMVTIVVKEARNQSFNILGQVEKPGAYPLDKTTTVLDSVALAGGFREWAKVKAMYVLRRNGDGSTLRIPFDYRRAINGGGGDFELQSRDTIVVP